MQCDIYKLFYVPLIRFKFSQHKKYFFKDIEKSTKLPKGWKIPLNTTFPFIGDDDNFIEKEKRDSLVMDILFDIEKVFFDLNIPTNFEVSQFWYNICHDNQGQERHSHLSTVVRKNPYWSGIYYNKNPNPTIFYRSDFFYRSCYYPGADKTKIKDAYWDQWHLDVEEGDIILFPPHLEHSVSTDDSYLNKMRLTFSFNIDMI